MTSLKKNLHKLSVIAFLAVMPVISLAQEIKPCEPPGTICNPIDAQTIQEFIKTFLTGILRIGIPVVAVAVIYCGFLFVKAQGKPEDLKKAKDALLYTLIGAAVLLGSWVLAILISETVLAL